MSNAGLRQFFRPPTSRGASPELLTARGERVVVSLASAADVPAYREAMTRSRDRIGRWNPVNPDDLAHHLAAQSHAHRTFLIRDARDLTQSRSGRSISEPTVSEPVSGGLVGCVNVSNVVQGRFMSATLGYNAFDDYSGTGMFAEGLKLVVSIALRPNPSGMGLHRVEANVQISNERSAGVLRSLGFRKERTVRRMLWLADGLNGPSAWRDHDSYAVTADEWPAQPYADHQAPRGVLLADETVSVPDVVAVARELSVTPLIDVSFTSAITIARLETSALLWHAGADAESAYDALRKDGVLAQHVSENVRGAALSDRAATASALRVRHLLQ